MLDQGGKAIDSRTQFSTLCWQKAVAVFELAYLLLVAGRIWILLTSETSTKLSSINRYQELSFASGTMFHCEDFQD